MQRILITGASKGIGRAIAERLASPGRELLIHGRDAGRLEETGRLVEKHGGTATMILCDLSRPSETVRLVEAVNGRPVHCLVNNAGLGHTGPLEKITPEQWQAMFDVNVTGPFLLAQGLVGQMPRGSLIINIISAAAKNIFPGWGAYTMTKCALDGFAKVMREELRPRGIRVVNLYPGATDTDIWRDVDGPFVRDKMMAARNTADAVAFVLDRPEGVLVEDITLSNLGAITE